MMHALNLNDIQPIHPFPARMAPSIVWDNLPTDDGRQLRILDPMMGSGTTLVSARAKGHRAFGCDVDPLAFLIARGWCSDVDSNKLKYRAEIVLEKAHNRSIRLSPENAYPKHADNETRQFLDFWFDDANRIQLTALSESIARIHDPVERTLLWCAFSRLIITKKIGVSLAMDISHSRPHKKYTIAPILAFDKFLNSATYVTRKAPFSNHSLKTPAAFCFHADARNLPFTQNQFDMVITSPPYLNAIDYMRGHKLSLVWMGHSISSIRSIRSESIGTERSIPLNVASHFLRDTLKYMVDTDKLNGRYLHMILRYLTAMNAVIYECRRVIKKNGAAVFVIGDSCLRGTFVKNSEALIHIAKKNGFHLNAKSTRPLPENRRYLPPPTIERSSVGIQQRMREEIILKFVPN